MANFLLGFLFALAVLVWSLASVKRLRRVSRFLDAVADALGAPAKTHKYTPGCCERERDVADALVNLRVPRKRAARAAAAAIAKLDPSASFDDHFRAAVGIAKETA